MRVVQQGTWALLVVIGVAIFIASGRVMHLPFPSDRLPQGAYLRIAKSIDEGHVAEMFPYLETEAQWASFSVFDARSRIAARVRTSYPETQRAEILATGAPFVKAGGGPEVFALLADQKGWVIRLRRDLSGVDHVETQDDRASVVTARGTRYAFRRRENGIWGLTLFTAQLEAESERAARDLAVVNAAADDYERAARATGTASTPASPPLPP